MSTGKSNIGKNITKPSSMEHRKREAMPKAQKSRPDKQQ